MRFVITLGPTKRTEGTYTFVKLNLEAMGHEVLVTSEMDRPDLWGKADGQIYIDFSQDCLSELPEAKVVLPSLCWQSDTHMGNAEYRLEQSRAYDHVWVAQKSATQLFKENGIERAEWVHHTAEHNLWCPPLRFGRAEDRWNNLRVPPDPVEWEKMTCEIAPRYSWGLVGYFPPDPEHPRRQLFEVMMKEFDDWAWGGGVFFEDAVRLYHRSRVVLNRSVAGEINIRMFEAFGSRTMLMTDRMEGMPDLGLVDGEHYIGYDSIGDCVEKMGYWLDPARDERRREIAWNGWRWFLHGHTCYHATARLLKAFGVDLGENKG